MSHLARRLTLAVALLAITAAVTGCGAGDARPTVRHVTVVLDWTPNTNHAGVYVAKQRGLYAEHGLAVDIVEPDLAGGLPQLASGRAQFAFSYAEQLLPLRAQGASVLSIATVLPTNTSALIAPTDRGIRRPRDLEGKTYGTYGGAIERPIIEQLVRCDGGDPKKVAFLDVGNADYRAGFAKHAYDVIWAFAGWDLIRLRDIDGLHVTSIPFEDHLDCIPDWYTPLIATTAALTRDDPDLVRDFLAATADGYELANSDPALAAQAIAAAVPEADPRLLAASARFLAGRYVADGQRWGVQDPAIWSTFDSFLRRSRIVTGGSAVRDAYTNAFLPTTP